MKIRFTLRFLLLYLCIVAVALTLLTSPARRQRHALVTVFNLTQECSTPLWIEYTGNSEHTAGSGRPAPSLLYHFQYRATGLEIPLPEKNLADVVEAINALKLKKVLFKNGTIEQKELSILTSMKPVDSIGLCRVHISREDLATLQSRFPNARIVETTSSLDNANEGIGALPRYNREDSGSKSRS